MAPSATSANASNVIFGVLPDPKEATEHFRARLAFETDAWDLHEDMKAGLPNLVVVDARKPNSFEEGHIPDAINVPYREIGPATLKLIPKESLIVAYCAGYHCNASTKAAVRLSELGYRVKELRDGTRGWVEEGYTLETGPGTQRRARIRATA